MKNKKILNIRNILVKLLVNFAVIFSMLSVMDLVVSSLVGNTTGNLFVWIMIILFSVILSVILYFIFKINRISILGQIAITYAVVTFSAYIHGYIIRIFTLHDLKYFIIAIVISVIGFIVLSTVLLLKNKKEDERLNRYLESFKERDHK